MGLTFRTATLSEGEEVVRVIRAAFTPYLAAAVDSIKQRDFADQLQERMVRLLTKGPVPANTAVQTIVLAKSDGT